MTVMLFLDTGDIAGALEIARYARDRSDGTAGVNTAAPRRTCSPRRWRSRPCVYAAGELVDPRLLTETLQPTATADMPDEVRAKLHKITGLFLRDGGDAAGALAHLQRATQLDCQAGVKKEIERLERKLNRSRSRSPKRPPVPRVRPGA